jgi:ribosomal-protein-alanine N-acetyltransferase
MAKVDDDDADIRLLKQPFPQLRLPIIGRRVMIRHPVPGDLVAWYAMEADPHVKRYLGATTTPRDEWIERMGTKLAAPPALVIEDRASGSFAGRTQLSNWHLDVVIAGPYLGKGYGREVAELIIAAAFEYMGAEQIIAVVHPENSPSLSLVESLGFVKFGIKSDLGRWDDGHLKFRLSRPARV